MMSSDRQRRIERQLVELQTVERPRLLAVLSTFDGKDPADQADRMVVELDLAQIDARMQRLNDLLFGAEPAGSTGTLHDATLVLDFGNGPESYRFGVLGLDDGLDVITPDSPLGRALADAAPGQRITYAAPRGEASVQVVSITAPAAAA